MNTFEKIFHSSALTFHCHFMGKLTSGFIEFDVCVVYIKPFIYWWPSTVWSFVPCTVQICCGLYHDSTSLELFKGFN